MYNNELSLISYVITEDEIGNEIKELIERKVLCKTKDVGSTEFYNAQVSNLKPEIKFIIHSFEYQGEKEVIFEGTRYQVMRTYQRTYQSDAVARSKNALSNEEIELTCERVIGNG